MAKDLCVRENKASLKGSKSRLGNKFTVMVGGGSGQKYGRDVGGERTLMFLPSPGSDESPDSSEPGEGRHGLQSGMERYGQGRGGHCLR